jgi:hypothetical protein
MRLPKLVELAHLGEHAGHLLVAPEDALLAQGCGLDEHQDFHRLAPWRRVVRRIVERIGGNSTAWRDNV